MKCETCRHYSKSPIRKPERGFGECLIAADGEWLISEGNKDVKFYTIDAAELYVKPDFGCVEHEEEPEAAQIHVRIEEKDAR